MSLKPLVVVLLGIVATGTVHAAQDKEGLGWVAGLAWTTGGDELAWAELVDEDGDTSSETIEAGAEFYLYGGLRYGLTSMPVDLQATLGWHTDGVDISNGEFSFDRMPVDLLAFYRFGNARVGGGLTYHLSPELDLEVDGQGASTDFDNGLGLVAQFDYTFSNFFVGARYTWLDYEVDEADALVDEVDANHFGIHGGVTF